MSSTALAGTAEALFERHFLPLYPPDARADLARARATDANPAKNPSVLAHLDEAAAVFAARGVEMLGEDVRLDFSDASVHRLSVRLDTARRDAWIAHGAVGTAEDELFNVVIHGAAYVGACIVRQHGGEWLARRPLWESMVGLSSRAGQAELAPFWWWLKSLADDSDATLADRYRAHVEVPCAKPEELPPIAAEIPGEDRALPRLGKVRYDLFYKYLRAHVPELRDVGRDFPSPERFDAYRFKWLDFAWLGGRRMLLVSGLGEGGLHLFWLTAAGFEKAVLVPCDSFPEPKVEVRGETVACIVSHQGKVVVQEMLWWGP
jgi:hypothetical protein